MQNNRLTVHYDDQPIYDIVFENSYNGLSKELEKLNCANRKVCIVTDSTVAPLYANKLETLLESCAKYVSIFTFPAGEENKTLDTVKGLYEHLILEKFDRKDLLLALGGGVVGDLTGFTAATYLRGIEFVQLPTTLLSQVDSSIGGKTGVDFDAYKNMVGAFHQPKLVYMNLSTLNTLSTQLFVSGISEIYKHGLIKNVDYYHWLLNNIEKILNLDFETLKYMIFESCNVKRLVVENDPTEKGERALLNLGHTIGHAVEKLSDFSLLHGECVSIGLVASCFLSKKRNLISEEDFTQIVEGLKQFGLPVCVSGSKLNTEDILNATKLDKKMEAGKIKFVLLKHIGEAIIDTTITDLELLEAIDYILED